MKLAIIIVLAATLQVQAFPGMGQNVNLSLKQTEIKKVLKLIESDGYYRFLYNSDLKGLKTKVDFSVSDLPLKESLDKLFSGTNLVYRQLENNLVIVKSSDEEENAKIKVTGHITGDRGESIAGASVVEKGTGVGTFADNNGNFTITVDQNATLVISSIGYETQEVKVNGRSVVDVKLVPSNKKSEEVVVIGYGTASRRDLTGASTKVKGDELAVQPNSNPLASLQNKVAGLSVVNTAVPGAAPDIRLRGTISINTIRPVYIVDGIFTDNIDYLNSSEIESMDVLKDASSLAIFGIKGASGAIVITTKKAKAGQTTINFSTSYGMKQLVDKIKLASGDQYRNLAKFEAGNRLFDDPSDSGYLKFTNNIGAPGMGAFTGNTDWIDAVTRTAQFSNTSLSVDGSSERNRFHFGIGYTYDEGLVKHVRYERMNANINDEFKLNKKVKIGFGLIASREMLPYNSGALEQARIALPILSATPKQIYTKNPYGVDSGYFNVYSTTPIIQNSETNPMATLENYWDKKIDERFRFVGNAYIDWNIIKDLNFRATWYADMAFRNNREYTPLYDLYDPTATGNQIVNKNSLTAVLQQHINTRDFQQDYIATYKKRFREHAITLTGGFTTYYHRYDYIGGTVSQKTPGINIIPNNKRFWYLNTGFGDIKSLLPGAQDEYTTVSGLARLLYNFKNKYYLNASYRRDASSQINPDYSKKFQGFWAVGAAWEISKEKFMEHIKPVDYLKLKFSTGLLGNFGSSRAYPAYPTLSTSASAVFGENVVPAYVPDYQRDPNLHWETVKSTDIGFEGDFLNRRLHFEAGYYSKKTQDLLIVINNGTTSLPTMTNSGSIRNSGFEFVASWNQKLMKDLNLTVGGNLTTFKNKVTYLPGPVRPVISSSESTPNQVETGMPAGYFYGLVVEGIYQSYNDILSSPISTINGGGAKPGDLKYKDLNGDGVITDADRTMIGNPTPDFTYGINIALKYKAMDLSIDMGGCYGNEIYRVWGTSEQKNSVYNYPAYYTEGWTSAGSSNWVPIVNAKHLINRAPSTYGIEDGSYFRIRNLSLGYTFTKMPKITGVKNLRAGFSVQNLKTWKKNMGYSPEFAGDGTSFGMDFGNAGSALPRIMTFSLNATF
ncbi:MAG: SusC/RagA family TonB-linked outer membrane protein [Ferruginibacter sp.]